MRLLCIIALVFSFNFGFSQTGIPKVSVSFENLSIKDALNSISEITDYQFYYLDEWVENQFISGNYEDTPLNIVLNDIFKETIINYYISSDYKIILTQNSIIHSDLLGNFTINVKDSVENEEGVVAAPMLYSEEKSANNMKIIRIGREVANNSRDQYTLTGHARNKKTGEPIPELAILVLNNDIGTVTDADGYYKIDIPSGYNILNFNALGIKGSLANIIIYNDGVYNFELNENLELLDEVIVEVGAVNNVQQAIIGVEQIEIEKVKTVPMVLGERDILRVVTTLPGITTTGEGASGYNVRGGKTDQNLMLLDNAVIYNPTHFFGIFSALNPYSTGGLDIYKGSIPAEYGGRLSSVFDIKTKNGNSEKFSGEGAIGPVTSNLTLEIPIVKEKSSLLVSGRGTYSDWILKTLDNESLNNSKASFYDLMAKYYHKINDKNNIEATAYYSKDNFSITSDSLYTYSNNLVSLKWNHQINDKHRGSLIFAHSGYNYNIGFNGDSNDNFDLGYNINETEIKLSMYLNTKDKHGLSYGISSKLYNNKPGFLNPMGNESIIEKIDIPEETALESAIYFSDDINIGKNFLLSAGIRYSYYAFLGSTSQKVYLNGFPKSEETVIDTLNFDKNEVAQTYGGPEIRVSGRYLLSPSLSIKASYNNTIQYIHTLSNNTTVSPTDTYKLSDLNLKPQRANQFSLGLFKNIDGTNYELSLEGYYKTSKNILDYKVGSNILLNQSIETEVFQGDGMAYGIELLLRKNVGKLNGWLGYSYSRSFIKFESEFSEERINQGEYFPTNYDKPHDISFVTNYKISKRFSFSANFIYQSGRPVTYPIGSYNYRGVDHVFYSNRNEFRIPDYYRLDVGLNIEGNHKIKKFVHSFWNISIYNLLGRNNPYSVFFVAENGTIQAYKSSIFAVPIPTITYNFKF